MERVPFVPNFARGLSVLVVDNETTSLTSLASMLEQCSYEVTTTKLASNAISMIRQQEGKFDLIMANINMKEVDGVAFLQWLLKKNLPVIVISSYSSVIAATKALMEGASSYLKKPIGFSDLKFIWQHACKNKKILADLLSRKRIGVGLANNARKSVGRNNLMMTKEVAGSTSRFGIRKEIQERGKGVAGVGFLHVTSDEQVRINDIDRGKLTEVNRKRSLSGTGDAKGKGKEVEIMDSRPVRNDQLMRTNLKGQDLQFGANEKRSLDKYNSEHAQMDKKRAKTNSKLCGSIVAKPESVLQLMDVPHVSHHQVSSHLQNIASSWFSFQKFKAPVQHICQNGTTGLPPVSTLGGYSKSAAILDATRKSTSSGIRHLGNISSEFSKVAAGQCWNAATERFSFDMADPGDWPSWNTQQSAKATIAPPTDSLKNEFSQPRSEYAHLWKLLEDEPGDSQGLPNEPCGVAVDLYCEWLAGCLKGANKQA